MSEQYNQAGAQHTPHDQQTEGYGGGHIQARHGRYFFHRIKGGLGFNHGKHLGDGVGFLEIIGRRHAVGLERRVAAPAPPTQTGAGLS